MVNSTKAEEGVASPREVRESVRQGIRDALGAELERTSSSTARRLALAAVLGLAGAIGAVVLFSVGSLHGAHGWHLAVCASAWAGLLVHLFSVVLLRIRAGPVHVAQAAALALVGFALAAVLGLVCPDPHYLDWWGSTSLGRLSHGLLGSAGSALCLGLCSTLLIGGVASATLTLRGVRFRSIHLPAALLFLLLWPAVVLQSVETPIAVAALWSVGLMAGSLVGVRLGFRPVRGWLERTL